MIDAEANAWLCGIGIGAVIGAAVVYFLQRQVFEFGNRMLERNAMLRPLLQRLHCAEGRYRQKHDQLGDQHQATCAAWDELREAGNAARTYLLTAGRTR